MNNNKVNILALIIASISFSFISNSYAANGFDCVLTDTVSDDGSPGDNKDTYITTTPEIFLICDTTVVKKGDVVKGSWTAIDTHNAAPNNYLIAEKDVSIQEDVKEGGSYTTDLSLTKPNKGWPIGTYKVDLYLNDKLVDTYNFSVK
ncbi:MAG TPA: hypothetical protein VL360_05115 [Gammaproteobacteria bacterium]|jgi:hypothetical protein|nr:hypothetical protein [Gammaproteobacteria bacterium]